MKLPTPAPFLFAAALWVGASTAAVAADAVNAAAEAEQTAKTLCAGCHGADGKTPLDPSYAIIAGQYADYLEVALKAYKSGHRKNPIMAGIAAQLSSAQIEALAEYYSKLPGPLTYKR